MKIQVRILIVADEQMMTFVLQRTIERLHDDCETVTARNGSEALSKAQQVPFDLVIADILMTGKEGMAFTERLRVVNPDAEVIWFTSLGHPAILSEGERLGVYHFLQQPLDLIEIQHVTTDVLNVIRRRKEKVSPRTGRNHRQTSLVERSRDE